MSDFDFDKCLYLIEADSYAYHVEGLVLQNRYGDHLVRQGDGHSVKVGEIHDERAIDTFVRPIMVTFYEYKICGILIGFYRADSTLVDWKIIREWIAAHYKGEKTNAMNMHQCLHAIDEKLAEGTEHTAACPQCKGSRKVTEGTKADCPTCKGKGWTEVQGSKNE